MTRDEFMLAYFLGDEGIWSPDLVWLRYIEAVATLRRLPEKWTPATPRTVMPPYARALDEEFGPPEPREEGRPPVKREAIDRVEEAIGWHSAWLSTPRMVDFGKALWIYAEACNGRFRLKTACAALGVSPPTVYKRKDIAIQEIAERLSTNSVVVGLPDYDLCLLIAVK